MTNAFTLDKKVLLQAKTTVRDALNKQLNVWENVLPGDGTLWAWVKDISGRQYVAGGATQNPVLTEIGIRRRAGVLPSMRILHGGFVYDIQEVLERDTRWTILMCRKEVFNG